MADLKLAEICGRTRLGSVTTTKFRVRWDEIDPIGHLRHTGYSTFAAQARVELFESIGIDTNFGATGVAPILFREELTYRREIRLGETVRIESWLVKLSDTADRWSIKQEVLRPDGQLAGIVNTDGAWIDLAARKLASPTADTATKMQDLLEQTKSANPETSEEK